ncbi:MAG: amidohydrolase family protein [Candidatus Binatia bacterium]
MNLLVRGRFVITQQERYGTDGIITDGAVYVSGREIIEVGNYKDLKKAYSTATVIGSPRFWVMPGFVNAHQHGKGLTQFQLGGLDEALELTRVKPTPQAKAPPYLDTLYAALRMIEAGVTTCLHYNSSRGPAQYETDVQDRIKAYKQAGIRVSFGLDVRNRNHVVYGDDEFLDALPVSLRDRAREKLTQPRTADPEQYFRFVKQLDDDLRNDPGGRIKLFLTPAGPQWCTEDLLQSIRRISLDGGYGIQIHVLETKYQRAYFSRTYGKSAVEWLDDLNFLSPQVSLAHGVWLSEDDISLVARRGSAVVHNPSSNLRLKSGIAPIALLYKAGIRLALGLDSSTLNDDMDMLQEMRLSVNLQRVPGITSTTMPLKNMFRMATVNGCEILGWGQSAGTLEPGKSADMILLDSKELSRPYLAPEQNPIDTLVYRGRAASVDTVIVDGEILYRGKKHRRLNAQDVFRQLRTSVQPAAANDGKSIEAELLPYAIRYYQAWDDEPWVPYHIVNGI